MLSRLWTWICSIRPISPVEYESYVLCFLCGRRKAEHDTAGGMKVCTSCGQRFGHVQ